MASFWDKFVSNPIGLLDAGISLASGIFNATSTSKANKQNVDLTREQMQWASDEAQKERDWERPVNQIKMMQEAGLSPLTYSSPVSQATNPNAPSAHPMQPVTFNSNPAREMAEVNLMHAEADKLRSDTDLNKVNETRISSLLDFEKENWQLDLGLKRDELEKMRPAQLENLQQSTENLKAEHENLVQTFTNLQKQWEELDDKHKRSLIENDELRDYLRSQIANNLASAGLAKEQSMLVSKEVVSIYWDNLAKERNDTIESSAFDSKKDTEVQNAIYDNIVANWKRNNPKTAFAIDKLSGVFGGVARGFGSFAGRIATLIK